MIRLILPLLLALSGCVEIQRATDSAARTTAKNVVPEALAIYFPQVPKQLFRPFTDCVVDNADGPEVASLAQDAVIGVGPQTADTIRTILARPQTAQCLKAAAPAAVLTL